jgi:hypothetical protein
MTDDELARLEAIARAADAGPWSVYYEDWTDEHGNEHLDALAVLDATHDRLSDSEANLEHIATFSPSTVLALLAEVRRLQERIYDDGMAELRAEQYRS